MRSELNGIFIATWIKVKSRNFQHKVSTFNIMGQFGSSKPEKSKHLAQNISGLKYFLMSRSQLAKLSAQYSLGAGLESRYFEYSTDQEQDCQDCCKYHITEEPFSHFCFMMTSTFKTDGFVCHPNYCQYIYFSTQYPFSTGKSGIKAGSIFKSMPFWL